MVKTCKCGNVLSDATVPNRVVNWTFFEDEWENRKLEIMGKIHFPFVRTVWHCDKCNRLYNWEPKDNKLYTYFLDICSFEDISCSCKDVLNQEKLTRVYTYTDYEVYQIEKQIKNGEEPVFLREVEFCPQCKRVYVKKDGNLKIFSVEEVIDLVAK